MKKRKKIAGKAFRSHSRRLGIEQGAEKRFSAGETRDFCPGVGIPILFHLIREPGMAFEYRLKLENSDTALEDVAGCASSREASRLSLIRPFAHPTVLLYPTKHRIPAQKRRRNDESGRSRPFSWFGVSREGREQLFRKDLVGCAPLSPPYGSFRGFRVPLKRREKLIRKNTFMKLQSFILVRTASMTWRRRWIPAQKRRRNDESGSPG